MRNTSSSNFDGESAPLGVPLYYLSGQSTDSVTFTVYQASVPIAEIKGPSGTGVQQVLWDMGKRVERSEAEQEGLRSGDGGGGRGGGGRGGRGRGRGGPPRDNVRYAYSSAPDGDYRVVMSVGGQEIARTVSILRDEWWRERE